MPKNKLKHQENESVMKQKTTLHHYDIIYFPENMYVVTSHFISREPKLPKSRFIVLANMHMDITAASFYQESKIH